MDGTVIILPNRSAKKLGRFRQALHGWRTKFYIFQKKYQLKSYLPSNSVF